MPTGKLSRGWASQASNCQPSK